MDYNIDNYTVQELLAILELDDPVTKDDILEVTNQYIDRFTEENQPQVKDFFQSIQDKLLNNQTEEWIKYQVLPQKDDQVQKDKNTDRNQKVEVYDDNHMPMNREQLGINNTYNVPVAQDVLNPNLKNVTSRFINLDSQFRQASGGSESISTDYTMDLSDPLTDVLSLSLYSIQIPYTWYAIDYVYGNTCFWVTNNKESFKIMMDPGNYNPSEFCDMLNLSFINAGFTHVDQSKVIVSFKSSNGKVMIDLTGWKDPNGVDIKSIIQYDENFDSETDAYFTFFDLTGLKSCYETGVCYSAKKSQTFDSTLGWLMGFRLPIQPVFSGGNIPSGIINLYGTKYFIVILDDFNQNRINNGLITITELSKSLSIPSYYNSSQPYNCINNVGNIPLLDINIIGNLSNISPSELNSLGINSSNMFNSLQDKINIGGGLVEQVLPSGPRTLTQAQIYTINEIIKNRNKSISFRSNAPTNSDMFAIIPIKYGSMTTGQLYTELSGQFQDNKRIYFGPVDIDRLRIRLLDDRGNLVDLHGADWCVTIISDNLYQY
jgi:hypothetical protein